MKGHFSEKLGPLDNTDTVFREELSDIPTVIRGNSYFVWT